MVIVQFTTLAKERITTLFGGMSHIAGDDETYRIFGPHNPDFAWPVSAAAFSYLEMSLTSRLSDGNLSQFIFISIPDDF